MEHDEGIEIPDITDQLESAYVRMLQSMVYPCSAISAEIAVDVIELSDGRKAQVKLKIDSDTERWL